MNTWSSRKSNYLWKKDRCCTGFPNWRFYIYNIYSKYSKIISINYLYLYMYIFFLSLKTPQRSQVGHNPKKRKLSWHRGRFFHGRKWCLEDDFPFPGGAFSGSMLIFRGVSWSFFFGGAKNLWNQPGFSHFFTQPIENLRGSFGFEVSFPGSI